MRSFVSTLSRPRASLCAAFLIACAFCLRICCGTKMEEASPPTTSSCWPSGKRMRSLRGRSPLCPARVLMQDFTGVPAIVDLAAMRDAMKHLGSDPEKINPLQPAELVIDHSVQVDEFGTANAYSVNAALEFQRNRERYAFLKWGQSAFRNFSAVPPGMGICHQVNLEYLARVVFTTAGSGGKLSAYPDTLGRHRLTHHHDQRARGPRLGRRRH